MSTPPTPPRPPWLVSTADVPEDDAQGYPGSEERLSHGRAIGKVAGLLRIGLHVERLPPGRRTSYPHAEEDEEEFAYVLEGSVDVYADGHLHRMVKGDLAAFPAGTGIAHTLINNGTEEALLLVGGEASKRSSRILYPKNPERRAQLPWSAWWDDAPVRTLGPHDGRPEAAGPAPAGPLSSAGPWDLVAEDYAALAVRITGPFSDVAVSLAGLSDGARVLDVAAGSGATTLRAARRGADVTAFDISAEMLAKLTASAAREGLEKVRVVQGDGLALPFEPRSFDAAFSMFGLMFFPDRHRGLLEVARTLRPGGTLVLGSWAPLAESPLMATFFESLAPLDPDAPPGPPPASMPLADARTIELELRRAGFVDVHVERHTTSLDASDEDAFWDTMSRANVMVHMLRKRLGEAVFTERVPKARAVLRALLAERGPILTTTALVTRAVFPG